MFVYFAQPKNGGLIKIGSASRPKARIAQLQVTSPIEIVLLAIVRGSRRQELALHEHFSKHRAHGEWFQPCSELLKFIESLPSWHPDLDESKLPSLVFQKPTLYNALYLAGYGQQEIADHFGFSRQRANQLITVPRRPKYLGSPRNPETFRCNKKPTPELPIADFIAAFDEPESNPLAVEYPE